MPTSTPTATPVPQASLSGYLFLDVFGDIQICDLCDFVMIGPSGTVRVVPYVGSGYFEVTVVPGAYQLYYTCEFNGEEFLVDLVQPSEIVLPGGSTVMNVVVGVCF